VESNKRAVIIRLVKITTAAQDIPERLTDAYTALKVGTHPRPSEVRRRLALAEVLREADLLPTCTHRRGERPGERVVTDRYPTMPAPRVAALEHPTRARPPAIGDQCLDRVGFFRRTLPRVRRVAGS